MKKWLVLSGVAAFLFTLAALGLFALLIWPTQWETHTLRTNGTDRLYRVDRRNGAMEVMTKSGWQPVTRSYPTASNPEALPLMSCAEYKALQAKGETATAYTDFFYRIPTNCP